ncbi:MAG: Ppx/GppA family phosphatase [Rickettsiales bacterium]
MPLVPISSLPADVAVIDIGSNSIRLVVYEAAGRIFHVRHNEKTMCGLAYGMDESGGNICEAAIAEARVAIGRYASLCKARGVDRVIAFATSALRDAVNANEILQWAKDVHGLDVVVLSEREEATYAARGVVQAFDDPRGVVADLGGGSLEMIDVPGEGASFSLPVGPLRFVSDGNYAPHKKTELKNVLAKNVPKAWAKGKTLYLVGGAFRNIAKFHMLRRRYPLHIIHRYDVLPSRLERTLEHLQRASKEILSSQPALSKKRAPYLPYVASLLHMLIDRTTPDRIVFSAAGVREGALFSLLPEDAGRQTLFEACLDEMRADFPSEDGGKALLEWLLPVVAKARAPMRLAAAACALNGSGDMRDGEFRAEFAYHHTMYSPLPALDHKERVWLTLAVISGYASSLTESAELLNNAMEILSDGDKNSAVALGRALRFARALSGNCASMLARYPFRYVPEGDALELTLPQHDAVFTKMVEKRLQQLSDVLSCRYSVVRP